MRLNKYQKNVLRAQKRKSDLSGNGVFVFRNNTSGDLFLPRQTKSGTTKVAVNQEFVGDDYYMFMVQSNELRLVKVIESPTKAKKAQAINESEEQPMGDKLITEQPPIVTNEGTVEFVEKKPKKQQQKLNETQPQDQQQESDVLLNENPLEGVEIL